MRPTRLVFGKRSSRARACLIAAWLGPIPIVLSMLDMRDPFTPERGADGTRSHAREATKLAADRVDPLPARGTRPRRNCRPVMPSALIIL